MNERCVGCKRCDKKELCLFVDWGKDRAHPPCYEPVPATREYKPKMQAVDPEVVENNQCHIPIFGYAASAEEKSQFLENFMRGFETGYYANDHEFLRKTKAHLKKVMGS